MYVPRMRVQVLACVRTFRRRCPSSKCVHDPPDSGTNVVTTDDPGIVNFAR